ncbi:hypothetical protein WDU94_007740, partial [Cyamophila willieti]
ILPNEVKVYVLTNDFAFGLSLYLYSSISLCLYRSNSRTPCPILMKFGRHVQHGQEIYCIVFGPRWPSPSGASGTSMSKILLTIAKHES